MSRSQQLPAQCRVGVDLVDVADVASAVDQFGDRYLQRVFTDHERASAVGPDPVRFAALAARVAAKEATIKVLRPTGARPDWRNIEVRREPEGACGLHLSGSAARLAAQAGLGTLAVSLTHEGALAAAVVVGVTEDPAVIEQADAAPRSCSTNGTREE